MTNLDFPTQGQISQYKTNNKTYKMAHTYMLKLPGNVYRVLLSPKTLFFVIKVFHRIIDTLLKMDENLRRLYFLKFPFWQNEILKAYTTGLILQN